MAQNMSYYMHSSITSEYIDNEVFEVSKHIAEAIQKTSTRRYKGPHRALGYEVLDRSSELGLLVDFSVLRRVTAGPYKLATTSTVFRHLCTKK
jgi:hypothetical protein